MIYVLDTDHLSILERGGANSRNLQVRLDRVNPEEIATTIVNYEEQMRGWLAWTATANTIPKLSHAYDRLHGHVRTFARITSSRSTAQRQTTFSACTMRESRSARWTAA